MVGQRHARVAIVLTDKAAFVAQSQPHEAGVADDDALQPQQFVEIDRTASGFADGAPPALDAVVRRILVLNGEAGFGVLEEKESRRAREQVGRHIGDGCARARLQVARGQAPQRVRPCDHGTEGGRSRQVVFDTVARGRRAGSRPLLVRIDD